MQPVAKVLLYMVVNIVINTATNSQFDPGISHAASGHATTRPLRPVDTIRSNDSHMLSPECNGQFWAMRWRSHEHYVTNGICASLLYLQDKRYPTTKSDEQSSQVGEHTETNQEAVLVGPCNTEHQSKPTNGKWKDFAGDHGGRPRQLQTSWWSWSSDVETALEAGSDGVSALS